MIVTNTMNSSSDHKLPYHHLLLNKIQVNTNLTLRNYKTHHTREITSFSAIKVIVEHTQQRMLCSLKSRSSLALQFVSRCPTTGYPKIDRTPSFNSLSNLYNMIFAAVNTGLKCNFNGCGCAGTITSKVRPLISIALLLIKISFWIVMRFVECVVNYSFPTIIPNTFPIFVK